VSTRVAAQTAPRDTNGDDLRAAHAFLAALKVAVGRDDRRAVAAMVQYPIVASTGTLRIPFGDAAALIDRYDLIFSPEMKAGIAGSAFTVPGQPPSRSTAVTSATAMAIAGGYINAEKIDGVFRITRISLPAPGGAAGLAGPTDSAPAVTPGTRGAARRGPERLTVRGRLHMAQATGTLSAGQTRAYVVWAGQGQLLEARVDGVRGREILLGIVNARTGTPFDARASEGVRRWSGRVPAAADYRIELKRGESGRDPAPRYALVVTVK
jgi:hypothetical protein